MLQLRCTLKVQKLLGLRPADLCTAQAADTRLGNWYANLFVVDRRKTLLFMNERTLLSFIVYGIRKDNSKRPHETLLYGLDQLLTLEGFDAAARHTAVAGYDRFEFTKTTSPKLLGNMNDLTSLYTHFILYDGGFNSCDLTDIMRQINRTPQRNLGWSNSIEMVSQLLSDAGAEIRS